MLLAVAPLILRLSVAGAMGRRDGRSLQVRGGALTAGIRFGATDTRRADQGVLSDLRGCRAIAESTLTRE
jgi:hypothetical protein